MVIGLIEISQETISTFVGYCSIVAWLFAQAPQLLENYKNGSVEGLALPFLVSWLFGDLTNLIGCVLTHQLPFQTYLASYFVLVDFGLMSQYIYYTWKNPTVKLIPHSHHLPRPHPSRSNTYNSGRRASRRGRPKSTGGSAGDRCKTDGVSGLPVEDPMERSWMSESSAHSAASTRPNTRPQTLYKQSRYDSVPVTPVSSSPTFPERGRTLTRPRVNVFSALETITGSPVSGSPAGLGVEGNDDHDEWGVAVRGREQHRHSTSASTSRTRPARRSASMVFLSVGLLVGFGRWSANPYDARTTEGERAWSSSNALKVPAIDWAHLRHPTFFGASTSPSSISPNPLIRHKKRQIFPIAVSTRDPFSASNIPLIEYHQEEESPPTEEPYPKRDFERFFGRASAWLCTTLYLTSRLPQIWQNFRRRSVEGLSMLLFIMAFIGNSLYVLSILSNPLMSVPGYLLESTPYLLGSGGTLCFDITIVMQSWLYSEKRRERVEREKRRSGKYGVDAEESAALLHTDGGADETEEDGTETSTIGGSRSVSRGRKSRGRKPMSNRRSESTELASQSRARWANSSQNYLVLSDQEFDEPDAGSDYTLSLPPSRNGSLPPSRSGSRSRPVSHRSRTVSGPEIDVIPEEGESALTLRS